MFELTFLGTGASVPSAARNVSALLVEQGGRRFLVDCGEGTQRQIMAAGVGFRRLDTVLLTHGHLDHILGLGGLAGTLNLWQAVERLRILAGPAPLELARRLLLDVVWPGGRPGRLALEFVPIAPGPLIEDGRFRLSAFPVRHAAPDCLGFRFDLLPHRPLLADRLAELGVPPGPERSRLARGEAVRLPDGRRVDPEAVTGPPQGGVSVAVVGDAETVDDLVEHVRGADLLVIEASFMAADAEQARAHSHLTVADAVNLARAAGIGRLCLNHQSSRYREGAVAAEAAALFQGARVVSDFERVRVP
ncbi:MBL fold metallo-hydrolase [Arenibaculum pallidiluteum]|uniref:MBL fold metallo-hydrolase n=1 Tax=Arenibaculum pallidiluteum TaxID=2812559 RepID=UPI001A96998A|nr:MBL fold metallo-hydrolase [Arenibaculum pallidiluteum]